MPYNHDGRTPLGGASVKKGSNSGGKKHDGKMTLGGAAFGGKKAGSASTANKMSKHSYKSSMQGR